MKLFTSGKSLEVLQTLPDRRIQKFYDKLTFKAVIPYYEITINLFKYQELELKTMLNLFMLYRNFITGGEELTVKDAKEMGDRFRRFMKSNNITKDFIFEVDGRKIIIQYFGMYPNMHYDFSKWIACLLGVLGLKIESIIYEQNYTRYNSIATRYFETNEPMIEERTKIFVHNMKMFTNLSRTINNDDRIHLWMKLAKNSESQISFSNVENGVKNVKKAIAELKEYSSHDKLASTILKMFEHFGWIKVEYGEELKIANNLSNSHTIEREIMEQIFNEFGIQSELIKAI